MEYAIRDIAAYARKYRASGKEIIYLNIGDPVKFDFKTPDHIKKAMVESVMVSRGRSPSSLRAAGQSLGDRAVKRLY